MASLAAGATAPRRFAALGPSTGLSDPELSAMMPYCADRVAAGERTDFGASGLAVAAVGAVVGYGTGAVIFVEGLNTASINPDSVVGLTMVAMPVIGILAAVGYSRHLRARHDAEIQAAMSRCLTRNGYRIEDLVLVE